MSLFQPLTTEKQREFYDALTSGKLKRGLFGLESRFSPDAAKRSHSFRKYFLDLIEPIFDRTMNVIDIGCGTGLYFPLVSPLCGSITGIELSSGFAKLAMQTAREYGLPKTTVTLQDSTRLGFRDATFDAALCVDSLHHVYDLDRTLDELSRVVKPGGDIVIFEPNVANPLLWAMCVVDSNEWGALSRCYLSRYRKLFSRHFDEVQGSYNGLLIGPQGKLATTVADFLLSKPMSPLLARFSPKLFYHLKNRGGRPTDNGQRRIR